jgi:hypothetical protein
MNDKLLPSRLNTFHPQETSELPQEPDSHPTGWRKLSTGYADEFSPDAGNEPEKLATSDGRDGRVQ